MKLSNFRFDRIVKRRHWDIAYASVSVTTGWWIFKTTTTMDIFAEIHGGQMFRWKFIDTCTFTPGMQAEAMYDEYMSKQYSDDSLPQSKMEKDIIEIIDKHKDQPISSQK